ncbi:biotin--[acetyl-CoA-carboxylase] ligase [Desulfopila sp. IMCC35006]|uniref:biotin--[acetyl-CoA-carboxylase] ligase n=1 Tax=Desulfopila sp. IMCC35006 TaxID=2569542 RepID=UPI0010ABFB55|nr:biotin--[acetyl-CoA-carboxylase] ligase [Desulfopila sp. IMCC35006]TKB28478.1 biotin--[acetyl-CoA-carboxylase] ligase [Desulfopila sp. IMCC35006]
MIENNPTPEAVYQRLQEMLAREADVAGSPVDAQAVGRYGAFIGSVINSHDSLPRAMDHARSLIEKTVRAGSSMASGTVILADTMTQSKGRFTRNWFAPPGGVWGCMIHANTFLPQSRSFISLATGLACCEAVREVGVEQATLRWVNDVLVDGKKLAGFLVETYTEPVHGEEFTLVGFGINANNCLFPADLVDSSVSLKQVLDEKINLPDFTSLFLARLAWNFGLLYHEEAKGLKGGRFSGRDGRHMLLQRWQACSDSVGKKVVYGFDVMTAPDYQAEVLGVDDDGGLVLLLEDGYKKTEYSGEIRYLQP